VLFLSYSAQGQAFEIGKSTFGSDNYIEYLVGNTPFVLSVPHGGSIEPSTIVDRNCSGCTYVKDSFTEELAREIYAAYYQKTGCYPHIIINLLHRKKLDMNREVEEATGSNTNSIKYWTDYQRFIDTAKVKIKQSFGKGLFLDIHGHGHTKQRIELGYLLTKTNLQGSDEILNTAPIVSNSSIKNLVSNNVNHISHAELIRGNTSFGSLLALKGYPGVPSTDDPFPLNADEYFNGGFNTDVHGSKSGGSIDAIQLELNSTIRFNSSIRQEFAEELVNAMITYFKTHYTTTFDVMSCGSVSSSKQVLDGQQISLYPNPTRANISYDYEKQVEEIYRINYTGQREKIVIHETSKTISTQNWIEGFYLLEFVLQDGNRLYKKVIKLD